METTAEISFNNLFNVLEEYADNAKRIYQNKLSANNVNASGNLFNSIQTRIVKGSDRYDVYLDLNDYWIYVENGRKAGGKFPPLDKILEWIKVKPVLPRPDDNGKIPTENQLSFLIGRKIAREGIEPRPLLAETINELNQYYLPKLQEALESDWRVFAYEINTFIGDNIRV